MMNVEVINLLNDVLEYDRHTYRHCLRVARVSAAIAAEMNYDDVMVENVYQAALLHDYGKIFFSKELLLAPRRYKRSERGIVGYHALFGYTYLSEIGASFLSEDVLRGILEHHEKLDGSGYPYGVTDFGIIGKILGVSDVYDAMTNKRCYKGPCSNEYAYRRIELDGGIKFDNEVIKALGILLEEGYDASVVTEPYDCEDTSSAV